MKRSLLRNLGIASIIGIGAAASYEIALGQEMQSKPNLRGYEATGEFKQFPSGLEYWFYLDTDGNRLADIVFLYKVQRGHDEHIHFGKPYGMIIDENNDNMLDTGTELYIFNENEADEMKERIRGRKI